MKKAFKWALIAIFLFFGTACLPLGKNCVLIGGSEERTSVSYNRITENADVTVFPGSKTYDCEGVRYTIEDW
jgi:hypothetical protein